jgi:hypothetical protein
MGSFFRTVGKNAWEGAVIAAWVAVTLAGAGVAAHIAKNFLVYGWNLIS